MRVSGTPQPNATYHELGLITAKFNLTEVGYHNVIGRANHQPTQQELPPVYGIGKHTEFLVATHG